ncbi:MAG TPA: DUF255 domain-containing protein [Epsilonproteobacteria bacterium]|nr:DUF255 domain-containing protein [Campylobacterota bacterium]
MKTILFLSLMLSTLLVADGKVTPKPLMLFVKMEHCQWCEKMQHEIFDNKELVQALRKKYDLVQITAESGNLPDFIKPRYFPTTYLLSPDTLEILDSLPGYRKKEKFLRFFEVTP